MIVNVYWSVLVLAFGCCVGSFLNVVIYRWPRDLSIRRPLWSFCPNCQATLGWRDNIPVVSFLLLGGRCRHCRVPISLQYPLVELATAFSFLVLYDALFVARLRGGVTDLAADWPMLLAHWALAAGLIVLTVMDLEAYLVDIRVTWVMAALGLVLHGLWTPASTIYGNGWIRPGPIQAAVAAAAVLGLAVGAVAMLRRPADETREPVDEPAAPPQEGGQGCPPPVGIGARESGLGVRGEEGGQGCPPPTTGFRCGWAFLAVLVVVAYIALMLVQDYQAFARLSEPIRDAQGRLTWPPRPLVDPGVVRGAIGLVVMFLGLTLLASHPRPEEDRDIIESLNAEAVDSRRNALWELKLLAPAILLMVLAVVLVLTVDSLAGRIETVLHARLIGDWQPLWGIATAVTGWIIGGGLAWLTRVVGTLGLGKEALGMGDVHIMAATGAIAGAWVAILGFFVASPLALLGILIIHLRRQSRALPYGPWLALGSLLVVLYQDKMLAYLQIADLLR